MSKQEPAPIRNIELHESATMGVSRLAELAQQAYEQKRTKDCLDLTRAILLIEPENSDAQLLRSSIRLEMHQHLENARALVRPAQVPEDGEPHSPSDKAEVPEVAHRHEESEQLHPWLPEPNPPSAAAEPAARDDEWDVVPEPDASSDVPMRIEKLRRLKRASLIVVFGIVLAALPVFRNKSNRVEVAPPLRASGDSVPVVETPAPEPTLTSTPLTADHSVNESPPVIASVPPVSRPVPKIPDQPVVLAASGTLAVSSATSVEIYMDDTYLGSAPVSLQISAGTHTLEYRHGNLRKRLTHVINSNETTKAMITFEATVQINARPWAEVFLDGVERKSLGQTPLSGVQVPIGGVLVFENPAFQPKKYRVMGNETGIQMVFP
jgi:hypothetical protein